MAENPIPGNPAMLRDLANFCRSGWETVQALRVQTTRLRDSREDWDSDAAGEFRERLGDLPTKLGHAEARVWRAYEDASVAGHAGPTVLEPGAEDSPVVFEWRRSVSVPETGTRFVLSFWTPQIHAADELADLFEDIAESATVSPRTGSAVPARSAVGAAGRASPHRTPDGQDDDRADDRTDDPARSEA
jgi:hypothetical protein